MEDMLYDVASMHLFTRFSPGSVISDNTTIVNFSHFLEKYNLPSQLLKKVNQCLSCAEIYLKIGTLFNAAMIEATSSTKNIA